MGDYLYGDRNFSHRTSFLSGEKLTALKALTGVGEASSQFGFKTQSIVFEEQMSSLRDADVLDGVSNLTLVCGYALDTRAHGLELIGDLMQAIEDRYEDWREVLDMYMADMAMPYSADLSMEYVYCFTREDWPAITETLGHGADAEDFESVKAARDRLYKEGQLLKVLLANALMHAMEQDLETMTLVDTGQGVSTNVWDIVNEATWGVSKDKDSLSQEDRERLIFFHLLMRQREQYLKEASAYLDERYDDRFATWAAMYLLYERRYEELLKFAPQWLEREGESVPVKESMYLRRLWGDALLQLERVDEARAIAAELEEAGDLVLKEAIAELAQPSTPEG